MKRWMVLRRRPLAGLLAGSFLAILLVGLLWLSLRPPAAPPGGPLAGWVRPSGGPLIIVAGGSPGAPPYTLPAFRRALAGGATALALPLQFTADGEPVVYPHPDVAQTTEGRGAVSTLTLSQLQSLDAGYRFADSAGARPFRGHGVQVPLLEEVLGAFPGVTVFVDVVDPAARPDHLERLARAVRRWGVSGMILLATESQDTASVLRRLLPETPAASTPREALSFLKLARFGLTAFTRPPYHLLAAGCAPLTPALVQAAHRSGLSVLAGPVTSAEELRRLAELGVDGLITSGPAAAPLPPPVRPAAR